MLLDEIFGEPIQCDGYHIDVLLPPEKRVKGTLTLEAEEKARRQKAEDKENADVTSDDVSREEVKLESDTGTPD